MIVDNKLYPIYPLKFIGITSAFRTPSRPNHSGLDLGWNRNHGGPNHDLIAICDAEVVAVRDNVKDGTGTSYGNYVLVQSTHDKKYSFIYAHVLKGSIKVKKGDKIKTGQVIAKMGNSGNSTGTHLHVEVRINNVRMNPMNYLHLVGDEVLSSSTAKNYKLLTVPKPKPTPEPEPKPRYEVGTRVKIKGAYAESSKSTRARHTRMVGYTRTIVGIYPGTNFPYRIGTPRDSGIPHTIGFAKETSIEKA